MYIVPNSTVFILQGIPINNNYRHTIYFDSANAQYAYFRKHVKKTFTGVSYQREKRGWMRVECSADELYNCNYLMYQNTAYNNKWFYAFIESVEFVNNVTCEVTFTLDVMQTWFFDYTLQACFVEREHSASDAYFANTRAENIGFGELVCTKSINALQSQGFNDSYAAVITSTSYSSDSTPPTKLYGRFCPVFGYIGTTDEMRELITEFVSSGKESAILSTYIVPKLFSIGASNTHEMPTDVVEDVVPFEVTLNKIGTYTPRNKKLLCYPYNSIWISNNTGTINEYRPEDFVHQFNDEKTKDTVGFIINATGVTAPCMTIYPANYRNKDDNYDVGTSFAAFPPVPFTGDVYAAYMAQNRNSILASVENNLIGIGVNTAMSMIGSVATANPLGVITSGVQGITQGLTSIYTDINSLAAKQADMQNIPPNAHNLVQSDNLNASIGKLDFTIMQMQVKPEYAKMIDDYFDFFGYACNHVKVPNRNVRPHWTFTKTQGCTINANCPGDDEDMICKIYDNGITFWKNGDEVGNYTLDNSPT